MTEADRLDQILKVARERGAAYLAMEMGGDGALKLTVTFAPEMAPPGDSDAPGGWKAWEEAHLAHDVAGSLDLPDPVDLDERSKE